MSCSCFAAGRCLLIVSLLFTSGCRLKEAMFAGTAADTGVRTASHEAEDSKTIYVVGHGWHTGLVLKTADIDEADFPAKRVLGGGRFIEIGWGDEGFYRAKVIWPTIVAKAIFLPSPSVLHVVGFGAPVKDVFIGSDIVELKISAERHRALCRYIHRSFALDEAGKPQWVAPGIYGGGQFFRGRESYYYPKTCNVWTANALQAAGVPMVTALSTTAGGVVQQAARHGRVLGKSSPMALIHSLTGTGSAGN